MKLKHLLIFLLFIIHLQAEEISHFSVKISVEQSGELQVTEKISYNFGKEKKYGVSRRIPYTVKNKDTIMSIDLGLYDYNIKMDGKKVKWSKKNITPFDAREMVYLHIGDPQQTITGLHTYTISYRVKKGVIPIKDDLTDTIRWNITGGSWRVPILKAEVDIYLPKSLTQESINVLSFTDQRGSRKRSTPSAPKWVDKHHLNFTATDLKRYEGITIEVRYPNGLLGQTGESNLKLSTADQLMISWQIPAIVLFLFFLYSYARRYGMGDYIGPISTQYHPPKGLTLLQSGVIYDKFADKRDFSAAVLELAQDGYIEIFDKEENSNPYAKNNHKDTSHLSEEQKYLLETVLFSDSDNYMLEKDSYTIEHISEHLDTVNEMLYSWTVTHGYMHKNPSELRNNYLNKAMLIMLPLILCSVYVSYKIYGLEETIKLFMGSIFIFLGLLITVASSMKKTYLPALFGTVWMALSIWGLFYATKADINIIYTPVIMFPLLVTGIWYFFRKIGPYRQKGLDTYRHLLGYKEFIQKVEKDKIEHLLKQDPFFLDKILPYAVLFDLSKHWLNFYSILDTEQPKWYHGNIDHMKAIQDKTTPLSSTEEAGS